MTLIWHYLRHWYWMALATLRLLRGFALASSYFKHRVLDDLQLPADVHFSSKEKRRLKHYFYGGTFLHVLFESLNPSGKTKQWQYRLSNLAALAYYFDDLVELSRVQPLDTFNWKNKPKEFGRLMDDHRQLALHFLDNLHASMEPEDQVVFDQVMYRVFNVELAAKQPETNLSQQQLELHSAQKGGNSVLLFRMIASKLPSAAEQQALFEFGHLIQACDDIFDVWFDIQDGVPTFAVHLLNGGQLKDLLEVFEQQVVVTNSAFRQSGLSVNRVELSLRVVHYISAITRVCLKHYLQLERKHGQLPLDNRLEMVVDMERWKNRLSTAVELAFRSP